MAWYKCGGGGALSETVLWTNSSPTSSLAAGNKTLSDDISNYKYLKIYWRMTVNQDIQSSIMVPVEEFKEMDNTTNSNYLSVSSKGNAAFARTAYYVNDTAFGISNCYQLTATTQNNGYCIITKVSGLK